MRRPVLVCDHCYCKSSRIHHQTLSNQHNIPSRSLPSVVRRGYLSKMGRRTGTWVRRWFVLYSDLRLHSCSAKEKEGEPTKVVDLGNCLFSPLPNGSRGKQYCFKLVPLEDQRQQSTSELVLAAHDQDSLEAWVISILRLKSGPTRGTGGAMSRAKAQASLMNWCQRKQQRLAGEGDATTGAKAVAAAAAASSARRQKAKRPSLTQRALSGLGLGLFSPRSPDNNNAQVLM